MSHVVRAAVVAAMVVSGLFAPTRAAAYSVLAHEANVDALWDSTIAPMLRARFPGASREEVLEARGYAYGGCVIQDLGYYYGDVDSLSAGTDAQRKRSATIRQQLGLLGAAKRP